MSTSTAARRTFVLVGGLDAKLATSSLNGPARAEQASSRALARAVQRFADMQLPGARTTWIVMLHGAFATVFESPSSGSMPTRVQEFVRSESPISDRPEATMGSLDEVSAWLAHIGSWLDAGCQAGTVHRLVLVAPEEQLTRLTAMLAPRTRGLLVALRAQDLSAVPLERIRNHVPQDVWT